MPGKSLASLNGRPSLERLAERVSRAHSVDKIVFATTSNRDDEPIAQLADQLGVACHRGSETDVLKRVVDAARSVDIDTIVHLTGDCPLLDADLIDRTVQLYYESDADYGSLEFSDFPLGFDVEVFSTKTLEAVEREFSDPWVREHVTVPLHSMPERFQAVKLPCPDELRRPNYRICIDTEKDLALVQKIFEHFDRHTDYCSALDIVQFLDQHPELVAINAEIKETKYSAAVIGLGNVGAQYDSEESELQSADTHASAFLTYGKTRLAAGCDIDAERRDQFSRVRNITSVYETSSDLLSKEKIDIVSIATPAESHAELCLAALDAGVKAVLCEKPFVCTVDEGKRVLEACSKHNAIIVVNHWLRWSPYYRRLKEFISTGQLGEISSIGCHYTKGVMNYGTYAIDLLRYLFGEVSRVRATERAPIDTGDENIGGTLDLEGDIPVFLTVNDYHLSDVLELEIIGSRGRLVVTSDSIEYWKFEQDEHGRWIEHDDPSPAPFSVEHGAPFVEAIADLVAFLDNGSNNIACSAEDGLRAVQVVLALKESADKKGKEVQINPL